MKMSNEMLEDNEMFLLNGSALTMKRIDSCIKDTSVYAVNNDPIGFKSNLLNLFVESQGYLKKKERNLADKKIKDIEGFKIKLSEDLLSVTYDSDLLVRLHSFYRWLMLKLHKNGATMGKKPDYSGGISGLRKKYGARSSS